MGKTIVCDHPLIQHKLGILRDVNTGAKEFRALVTEIAMLMGYELTKDFQLEDKEIETPMGHATVKVIAGKKVAIVPILRAGLGMVDGFLNLIPAAKVGAVRSRSQKLNHKKEKKNKQQRLDKRKTTLNKSKRKIA